jgi:hypothetical protein
MKKCKNFIFNDNNSFFLFLEENNLTSSHELMTTLVIKCSLKVEELSAADTESTNPVSNFINNNKEALHLQFQGMTYGNVILRYHPCPSKNQESQEKQQIDVEFHFEHIEWCQHASEWFDNMFWFHRIHESIYMAGIIALKETEREISSLMAPTIAVLQSHQIDYLLNSQSKEDLSVCYYVRKDEQKDLGNDFPF